MYCTSAGIIQLQLYYKSLIGPMVGFGIHLSALLSGHIVHCTSVQYSVHSCTCVVAFVVVTLVMGIFRHDSLESLILMPADSPKSYFTALYGDKSQTVQNICCSSVVYTIVCCLSYDKSQTIKNICCS